MNARHARNLGLVGIGFGLGLVVANLPGAAAAPGDGQAGLETRKFRVFVDEVKQNLVFGDEFAGSYSRTFTLSDGSTRTIQLTPMVRRGMQVVEFKDTGGYTYMGLNGTTTNGTLMVQLRDVATQDAQLRAEGWPTEK